MERESFPQERTHILSKTKTKDKRKELIGICSTTRRQVLIILPFEITHISHARNKFNNIFCPCSILKCVACSKHPRNYRNIYHFIKLKYMIGKKIVLGKMKTATRLDILSKDNLKQHLHEQIPSLLFHTSPPAEQLQTQLVLFQLLCSSSQSLTSILN